MGLNLKRKKSIQDQWRAEEKPRLIDGFRREGPFSNQQAKQIRD